MSLIKPTVYAELVATKVADKCKVANLSKNCGYLMNTTVGNTVTFPKWSRITDAVDRVQGTAIGTTSLEQTSSTATVKLVAPDGVAVYDMDNVTALGDAIEESANQQATAIARKLDSDLITEAKTTDLQQALAEANAITAIELNSALGLFGDEQDTESFAGIVINSRMLSSFLSMSEFTSTEKTYMTMGNGIIVSGLCGYFRGIPVFMANHGTYDSTNQESLVLIIKNGALGYMPKENVCVEEKREAEYRRSTIFSSQMYAVKLLADDGVVLCKKTLPSD